MFGLLAGSSGTRIVGRHGGRVKVLTGRPARRGEFGNSVLSAEIAEDTEKDNARYKG
jgi:hypothetical protein